MSYIIKWVVVLCIGLYGFVQIDVSRYVNGEEVSPDVLTHEYITAVANEAFAFAQERYPIPQLKLELKLGAKDGGIAYFDGIIRGDLEEVIDTPEGILSLYTSFTMRQVEFPEATDEIIAFTIFHEYGHAVNDTIGDWAYEIDYAVSTSQAKTILQYKQIAQEQEADDFAIQLLNEWKVAKSA